MSNSNKRSIPSPPLFVTSGNLLSNVAPPTQLPNFITTATAPVIPVSQALEVDSPLSQEPKKLSQHEDETSSEVLQRTPPVDKFSPAIPLDKGEPTLPIRSPEDSLTNVSAESLTESMSEVDRIGDIMPGSGLFTWMKGAVSSGGILQRVAEKARNSMDSMITTLDPQMKEYLKSGGDLLVVVASDKDVKISPVREAFQTVFGKATVIGYAAQSDVTAEQPVGYAAAYAAAKQRIAFLRSVRTDLTNDIPILAIESFIQEVVTDRWFELSLLVLSQPAAGVELQLQAQAAPLGGSAAAAREATPADYPLAHTGFAITAGSIMAASLQVPHTQWYEAATGVSRREVLLLAARSLAGSYKRLLAASAVDA